LYAVSFVGALKPVNVQVISGRICRSHRGTMKRFSHSEAPMCEDINHTLIGKRLDK
jgi:hypothetical protein